MTTKNDYLDTMNMFQESTSKVKASIINYSANKMVSKIIPAMLMFALGDYLQYDVVGVNSNSHPVLFVMGMYLFGYLIGRLVYNTYFDEKLRTKVDTVIQEAEVNADRYEKIRLNYIETILGGEVINKDIINKLNLESPQELLVRIDNVNINKMMLKFDNNSGNYEIITDNN